MLLRENTIKWWFVIQPLLTNVSALPGETWTPEIASFQSYCIPCLENDTALACYIFNTHHLSICHPLSFLAWEKNSSVQPSFETATDTISDEENVGRQRSRRSGAVSRFFALLGARSRSFCKLTGDTTLNTFVREEDEVDNVLLPRHSIEHDWKRHSFGIRVSPGSAETLVRRLFDSVLSQQHLLQILLKSVDVRWCYSVQHQCCFFETVYTGPIFVIRNGFTNSNLL